MILLAVLLSMQAAPVPVPAASDDIIVTARRMEQLKRLRMTTKFNRKTGVTRCVFNRRSGYPALDAAVCNAVLACVPMVKTVDAMRICMKPAMDGLVAKGAGWQAEMAKGGG